MTHMRTFRTGLAAMALTASAAMAASLPPLDENAYINDSLLSAAIGDEIRKNCPTIGARIFRALAKAKDLERHALKLGYTEKEIEAFIDSKAEQTRMKALRDAYLAKHGVTKGDADSYCKLGYEEIEKDNLTGYILYKN